MSDILELQSSELAEESSTTNKEKTSSKESTKSTTVRLRHHDMLMQIVKPQKSSKIPSDTKKEHPDDDVECGTKIDIDEIGEFVSKLSLIHI